MKHFVSVLGTSTYAECIYYQGEQEILTSFVQEASIKLMGEMTKEDRITIFVTKEARKRNWENRLYTESDIGALKRASKGKEIEAQIDDEKVGLKQILIEQYGDIAEAIEIPDGRNKEEQEEIFDKIYECLREEEEVYFDITHGFRTIPMLAVSVLNYAKVLKNIEVKGIVYGAYEPGAQGKVRDGFAYVPIQEYSIYMDILEWSAAANSFIRYGNSGQIDEIYQKLKKQEFSNKGQTPLLALKDSIRGICELTSNIETCKGRYNGTRSIKAEVKYSIRGAYQYFKNSLQSITVEQRKIIKPFEKLLNKIEARIDSTFKNKESDELMGLATVKWCIENKLIQQGFTALEESITTYTCMKYGWDYNNRAVREDVSENVINYLLAKLAKRNVGEPEERYKAVIEEIPLEMIQLAGKVKGKRNYINHFGYNENEVTVEKLRKDLQDYYNLFVEIVNR